MAESTRFIGKKTRFLGITHGFEKPGFSPKYFVTGGRIGKKPGFFGPYRNCTRFTDSFAVVKSSR
jgi:hypothetical protein